MNNINTKNRRLSIKLTQEHWNKIHHKAKQSNKNLTDYVTTACLGKPIVIINELDAVLKEQKAIGRNLNRLTTLANMKAIDTVYLTEATMAFTDINKNLQKILERSGRSNGNS